MYRDYCIEGNFVVALGILAVEDDLFLADVLAVAAGANGVSKISGDDYHEWVLDWKFTYNQLSNKIHKIRVYLKDTYNMDEAERGFYYRMLNGYRLLANTMLNARQYAADSRRAARTKLH